MIDSLPGPQRQEFSGKFNVRIPKSLHAALVSEAEKEGVSLNRLVLTKLALHLQVRLRKGASAAGRIQHIGEFHAKRRDEV